MKAWTIAAGLVSLTSIAAVVVVSAAWWSTPSSASRRAGTALPLPAPAPAPAASVVTVVHKYVVTPEGEKAVAQPSSGPAEEAAPAGPSAQEAVFQLDQRFEAIAEDHTTQVHNEQALRTIFGRVAGGKALPIDSFACRGPSCRVAFNFDSVDQARAVLNKLPSDDDWDRNGLGFNALPLNPDDPTSNKFVAYFTAVDPRGASNGR